MSRLNWFDQMCEKASNGDHHIDHVVVRHGIRIITVFEDREEHDTDIIEAGNTGFFRYAVVNPTHRTMWIRFDTQSRRKAILLDESPQSFRTIEARKRRKRRINHIPYEARAIATVS